MHDCSLSLLGTGTSIKSVGGKLVKCHDKHKKYFNKQAIMIHTNDLIEDNN